MRFVLVAIALAGNACAQTPTPLTPSEEFFNEPNPLGWIGGATLSPQGLGEIHVGKSIAPVHAVLNYGLERAEPVELSPGCDEWSIASLERNAFVSILTQDLIVGRVSLHGPTGIRTAEGIAVGDTAVQVLAAYPSAERVSAEYTPDPGHELFVWTDRENHIGLRFEIGEDGRVTAIHAGSDLRNDEGCMTA